MTKITQSKRLEIINSLPIEADFSIPMGIPIPIGSNVLVKPIIQREIKLDSGVLLGASSSRKKQFFAVVYGIGEEVTKPLREGLKIEYEEFAHTPQAELIYRGDVYVVMSEHAIRAIVPPDTFKYPIYESNDEIRRQNRIDNQKQAIRNTDSKIDKIQNE